MLRTQFFLILLACIGFYKGCDFSQKLIQDPVSYRDSVENWQQDRLEDLKSEEGWLNLAGIYWLKEGSQTFGSDATNDLVFPAKAPAFLGSLTLKGESLHLKVKDDVELFYEGKAVKELDLSYDKSGSPSYVSHGDFAWYIMKRHHSLALRLRDYKNPAIDALDHIPTYPIDPEYLVEAQLKPFEEPRTITVNTPFQDYTQDYTCPGELHFKLKGEKLKLLPFESGADYFIIISDETSGLETYGGGRFMYASPDSTGRILLDFNKAYNPPCAVTPFAACPMPPRENHLAIPVEAGEKVIAKHKEQEKVLAPWQDNEFVWVYKPTGDYFFGPDTEYLKEGEWYEEWVANDHTFVKAEDGRWHILGITHPLVESDPLQAGIHDGEYASFHAVSSATSFKGTLKEHHYSDLPKVLPPKERPGEVLANHAPYIVQKDGLYQMVYGHSPIRLAVSADLSEWEPKGNLFTEADGTRNAEQLFGDARDPNLLFHDGIYYIVYCSTKSVNLRESKDLIHWSEPTTILKTETFDPESPSLIFHNNTFYLFVCSWDGIWDQKEIVGAYQHKTYVLQSDNPLEFGTDDEKQVALLNAHAPEIFQDEDGQWYISSVEWPNRGVSVDKLFWE